MFEKNDVNVSTIVVYVQYKQRRCRYKWRLRQKNDVGGKLYVPLRRKNVRRRQ